jgi:hypothetical protein
VGKGTLFVPAAHGSSPYPILPTLKRSNGSAPRELGEGAVREPPLRPLSPIRRFHLRLLRVLPLRGTGKRSDLFESHWSNQWLTLEYKDCKCSPPHNFDCPWTLKGFGPSSSP